MSAGDLSVGQVGGVGRPAPSATRSPRDPHGDAYSPQSESGPIGARYKMRKTETRRPRGRATAATELRQPSLARRVSVVSNFLSVVRLGEPSCRMRPEMSCGHRDPFGRAGGMGLSQESARINNGHGAMEFLGIAPP
jgi:hypothetical protein